MGLIESASETVFVKDCQGRFLVFNGVAAEKVGRPPQDILGKDVSHFLDAESARQVEQQEQRILRTGQGETDRKTITCGGVTRLFETSKTVLRGRDGEILGLVGRSHDVTEARLREDNQVLSREELEATAGNARVGWWELNLLDETVRLSSQSRLLLGVEQEGRLPQQVAGRNVHPDDRESAREALSRAIESGGCYESHYRIMVNGVTVRNLRSVGDLERGPDGTPVRFFGTLQDITERTQAEAALKQGELVLRLVLDALPVAVQVMDRTGHIFLSNPACARIWGKTIGDGERRYGTVKARWHDTQEPLQPYDWASVRALSRGETSHSEMIDIEAFDGQSRTILNSAIPIREPDGDVIGAVIINEDITNRLALEKQFLQAQKMEAIGHLAGGVAHDFNNLLTVISGCAQLLKDGHPDSEALLDEILQASERGSSLTNQLLAFSRQTVLQPQVVELNQVVRNNQSMLGRLLSKEILLEYNLDEADGGFVQLDPNLLSQALMNLVVNARDAMPHGGTLRISTTAFEQPDPFLALVVSDDGVGMSDKVKEHLFEPFFTTKTKEQGTGLGLATVYGIVEQSGGTVDVESAPGAGSTFRLIFPRVTPETSSETVPVPILPGSESVLLVEDQPAVRAMLATALARCGYDVMQAADGREALQVWDNQKVDLLVTDVVMPGLGGRNLVEQLRRESPELKVIYMSGHTTDAVVRHGVQQADVAFLQKPFGLGDLTRLVRKVLDDQLQA